MAIVALGSTAAVRADSQVRSRLSGGRNREQHGLDRQWTKLNDKSGRHLEYQLRDGKTSGASNPLAPKNKRALLEFH
jgi:hypothetical protein